MLIKAGVDISRLNREIRRALNKVASVYYRHGQELIVTSTYEGDHSAGSLHYANNAFDCRLPDRDEIDILREIIESLGDDFDIVREATHIHIEYDPKKK